MRLATVLLLLFSAPVLAADPAPRDQLAGLFIQGCLPFTGDPGGLRSWAAGRQLQPLPEAATKAFLLKAPGRAFDASAENAKLVLASSDDGICSAITDKATSADVAQALEAGLKQAGAAFRLAIERDDTGDHAIHYREYLATRNGRSWRILAATVNDPAGGRAMLTGAPE